MKLIRNRLSSIVFVLLFHLSISASAQQIITGIVLSETTGLPVEGASVYFNNTSIGTSASNAGKFSLPLPGFLNAELIISAIGYELMVFNVGNQGDKTINLVCKLSPKTQQLREVLILTDAVRKKFLSIFESNFLGITEEASRSSIENRKDIYFTSGEGKNSFRAYSDTPLVIINKMLGYKISFDLVDFLYNEQLGSTFYYGYVRFEEMGDKKRWQKNRRHCYYGSTMHFFRSLIANRLKEESFRIYLIKPVTISQDSANKIQTKPAPAREEMSMAVSATADQILKPDSSNADQYNVAVTGKLMVQYDKDPTTKLYLRRKIFIQGSMPVGVRSFITAKSAVINLSSTGIILNPMDVFYSGYWIYEKTANMLPFNYVPD